MKITTDIHEEKSYLQYSYACYKYKVFLIKNQILLASTKKNAMNSTYCGYNGPAALSFTLFNWQHDIDAEKMESSYLRYFHVP